MLEIDLKIGRDDITSGLGRLEDLLGDLSPFTADAATIMEARVKEFFARQAGPSGSWAPLAPSTVARKGSAAILRETGAAVNAVSSSSTASTAKVTQGQAYMIFHQYGTSRAPAREHLGFDAELESRLKDAFEAYLEGLF